MCGWQVKLCTPSLTCAIPEHFREEFLMIKCCIDLCLLYFTLHSWTQSITHSLIHLLTNYKVLRELMFSQQHKVIPAFGIKVLTYTCTYTRYSHVCMYVDTILYLVTELHKTWWHVKVCMLGRAAFSPPSNDLLQINSSTYADGSNVDNTSHMWQKDWASQMRNFRDN